ncbi:hypothetical protein M3638_10305 [Oceanobacillus profundus]|uniref:hypothetical protein n=1 Tax=Oceanobacillus profundus TaxID=372463 RepID=UPI00203CD0F3|nr:hypothetical protein [Oceanobacillus profundus]MCM3398215.1 hypothetical protein [Oceanobacillus profundus]
MAFLVNNRYRIRRNAQHEKVMQTLMDAKVFGTYRDILVISAIIGFNNEEKEPIEKAASDGVLMQFFKGNDYDLINLIAYADTGEKDILNQNEKYSIFEQYANGGFPILLELLDIVDDGTEIDRQKVLINYFNLITSGSLGIKETFDF